MKGFSDKAQASFVPNIVLDRGWSSARRAEYLLDIGMQEVTVGKPRTVRWDLIRIATRKARLCIDAAAILGWHDENLESHVSKFEAAIAQLEAQGKL